MVFRKMADASQELNLKLKEIRDIYPRAAALHISPQISDNITLSTMHGCPPDEIEKIGEHLLREKKLHTIIKLNPTLLGKKKLHSILKNSGFETRVPDLAFEHDLKYPEAVGLITRLKKLAEKEKLSFGLKLTNTLESSNHKEVFPPNEEMMYLSGRALHPLSVNLASRLQNAFNGLLNISFSGGADAFNTPDLIAGGLSPVTVCSDILKPGGYGRLHQYMDELQKAFAETGATDTNDFIAKKSGLKHTGLTDQRLYNLRNYAGKTLEDNRYKRTDLRTPGIKTSRPLGYFDCIHAPCVDTCPTNQDIPDYMYHTAHGDFEKAFEVIMKTNPFPNTTGMVCDHLCQTKCTRIDYDSPLLIREIKRFVAEEAVKNRYEIKQHKVTIRKKVAVIGAGPSGLSCAYFLVQAGFEVNIYEAKPRPGGMVSGAIPSFRLTDEAVYIDIHRIEALGVKIHFDTKVDKITFNRLREENDVVYLAAGAQKSRSLLIEGSGAEGVLDPLGFLFRVKEGKTVNIGKNVAIIGGGNTAMDAARTAHRLVGDNGKVTVLYRRSMQQMPADMGEISAVVEEGVEILELVSPVKINSRNGKVISLTCVKMKLGEKDESGRARPEEIPGSEFEQTFDTIIPAIGQDLLLDFVETKQLKTKPGSYETGIENIFIGGDALRGASTAINAIGDGRKAANEIIAKAKLQPLSGVKPGRKQLPIAAHMFNRAQKTETIFPKETSPDDRKNFRLVTSTLTREEAQNEASRCLLCDEVCNICTTVCPNLAFHAYETFPRQWSLQKISGSNGTYELADDQYFRLDQKLQILHLADWCNECGNCVTFCPSAGKPYLDKPHLYLKPESFEANRDGYFFDKEKSQLRAYEDGDQITLQEVENSYIFQNQTLQVQLDKKSFRVIAVEIRGKTNFAVSLTKAAQMSVILKGAQSFFGIDSF